MDSKLGVVLLREREPLYRSKWWLAWQYLELEKSANEIAQECGCHPVAVYNNLRRHGIPIRTKAEARRVSKYTRLGEENPSWKGEDGVTPLRKRIRHSFKYRLWRSDVFTRDDFTCQECGRRGVYLHAHHSVVAFVDILELNDIRTYEQAMACEELWNINNGVTLCVKCHKLKEVKEDVLRGAS